jgi:hypothetical protein
MRPFLSMQKKDSRDPVLSQVRSHLIDTATHWPANGHPNRHFCKSLWAAVGPPTIRYRIYEMEYVVVSIAAWMWLNAECVQPLRKEFEDKHEAAALLTRGEPCDTTSRRVLYADSRVTAAIHNSVIYDILPMNSRTVRALPCR